MDQVKVSELASEFEIKNSIVISELKKIGVWVPSPDTPVDHDIANRIRRRLQLIVELEQEEQTKTKEKKEKKAAPARARKTIKELGKPRKKAAPEPEVKAYEGPLAASLKPRKGKASYRHIEAPPGEIVPEKTEVTIDDEPVIEKVEAQAPPELLEQALQQQAQAAQEATSEALPAEPVPEEEKEAKKEAAREPASAEAEVTARPAKASQAEPRVPPAPVPLKGRPPLRPAPSPGEAARAARRPEKAPPGPPLRPPAGAPPPRKPVVTARPQPVPRPATAPPKVVEKPVFAETREIVLPEAVTVKELGEKLGVKSKDVLKDLLLKGVMASINHTLDQKTVEELCTLYNAIPRFVTYEEALLEESQPEERPDQLQPRAPVVTVMGHVDHGKTSLLDAIRQTKVAAGEAGGITQHIGAHHVEINNKRIVFLDTPGHEAFTLMRARGAQATDIVVLVVAADDGVMPQTVEAIAHARAAGVPIIVAINKIDKPDAQVQRVKQELSQHELVAEDWGGDTVMVEVSAKEHTNLDLLLEMILLVADLRDLKANPARAATGLVLEAKLDKGRGSVATLLVQNGSLSVGDLLIAGTSHGKIRAMFDDRGRSLNRVGPGSAVEVLGLQGLPLAGDPFQVVEDAAKARQISEYRLDRQRQKDLTRTARVSLDELYAQLQAGQVKELPMVLKADAQGSVEVVAETLSKLSTDKVRINIIHSGVGAISESDVLLASASNAIVIGFNVRPEQNVQEVAERERVDVRLYTVIYDIATEIKQAMIGLLDPAIRESVIGRAEVREIFRVPKFGTIAGCHVTDGEIRRNGDVRLLRDNVVVYQGKIDSLRRFKEDVNTVRSGYECGISIANFNDIKIGDVIECFVKEEVTPEL